MNKIYRWLFMLGASFALMPSAGAQTSITGAQVFNASMLGQSWTFTNNLGDQTFISIGPLPANNAYCVKLPPVELSKEPGPGVLVPRGNRRWFAFHSLPAG